MYISFDDVTETDVNFFTCAASELGIDPGSIPDTIETCLGNGNIFHLNSKNEMYYTFIQEGSPTRLKMWDD